MAILQIKGLQLPCQGILFDKDGTLLEFLQLWGPWADSLLNQLEAVLSGMGSGFTVERGRVLGTVHDSEGHIIDYDRQGPLAIATVDESTGLLAGQLYAAGMPWNDAITTVRELSNSAMQEVRSKRQAEPMPGLVSFLESCRAASIKVAVVTSDSTSAAEEHLEWMGIRSFFTSIVGCDCVTLGKPNGETAKLACQELHIHPNQAIVIGDSNGDMQMGLHAGVSHVIGVCPPGKEAVHLQDADVVIGDYHEIRVSPDGA